jgi:hypothetical protein
VLQRVPHSSSIGWSLRPIRLRLLARSASHSAVFFSQKNQPNQPDFSPSEQAASACVPVLTWSDCSFDFGQHHLHHHPHLYTCLSTCPSLSRPRSILWPSVPWSKLRVCPSPLPVHRTRTPCLTFSIAIDRLTLNTCTLQRKVWTHPNDPKPRKGKERRSWEMSKLGPQRHEQWLDATEKKQSLVPNDMSKSSTEPSKRGICLVLS